MYYIRKAQCHKCAITGLLLIIGRTQTEETTASIDRIDSSKGYIEGNIQIVHKIVNKMKGELSQHQFFTNVKQIHENQLFLLSGGCHPDVPDPNSKEDYEKYYKGKLKDVTRGNGKRKNGRVIEMRTSYEDLCSVWPKSSRGYRGVLVSLKNTGKNGKKYVSASLDRIDSSGHYELGNLQWIHKDVNYMKGSLSHDEFLYWIKLIYEHNSLENYKL